MSIPLYLSQNLKLQIEVIKNMKDSVLSLLESATGSTAMSATTPTLCLTMIVKQESKIIERCLNSAKDVIDYVCITDTGSTDDTPAIIEKWCKKHNIPYKVCHDKFKGFGPSRTQSFRNAKANFPKADYCLLLDADMELETPNFNKMSLTAPSYRVNQYGSNLVYPNTRIINTKYEWKVVCRTHEFWESSALKFQKTIPYNQLRINDHNDGGCKSDKFERDLRLLKQDIAEGIQVARNTFYLAQTLKDLGQNLKAIKRYTKRMKLGAWPDEVWYSQYMIGKCYLRIAQKAIDGDIMDISAEADGTRNLLLAFNTKPNRAEPIMELASYYRKQGKNLLAYHFATMALDCDPTGELLFVELSKHSWEPHFEICITAFYVDKKKEGLIACNKVLSGFGSDVPKHIKLQAKNNKKFYK